MGLFNIHKKKFTYQSDAQLIEALIDKQQDAFDYVFKTYKPLLKSLVESTFKVSIGKEEAEQTLKKPCTALQDYLLANKCAELSRYNPDDSSFENWLASKSQKFFKTFYEENTTLLERYRKGDHAIVFQRYKKDFEQKIRLGGIIDTDIIEKEAEDLSQNVYIHLFNNNYQNLNQYKQIKGSFDDWFRVVLKNYSADQHEKEQKKVKDVIDSGGFVRIDDNDTFTSWERFIQDTDDEEKKEMIETLLELLNTLEPPRYREILLALYFKGEKKEDIAQRYEVTMDNFYNITKRALDRFRQICKEHGFGK